MLHLKIIRNFTLTVLTAGWSADPYSFFWRSVSRYFLFPLSSYFAVIYVVQKTLSPPISSWNYSWICAYRAQLEYEGARFRCRGDSSLQTQQHHRGAQTARSHHQEGPEEVLTPAVPPPYCLLIRIQTSGFHRLFFYRFLYLSVFALFVITYTSCFLSFIC